MCSECEIDFLWGVSEVLQKLPLMKQAAAAGGTVAGWWEPEAEGIGATCLHL
jgi:hypothetical protein